MHLVLNWKITARYLHAQCPQKSICTPCMFLLNFFRPGMRSLGKTTILRDLGETLFSGLQNPIRNGTIASFHHHQHVNHLNPSFSVFNGYYFLRRACTCFIARAYQIRIPVQLWWDGFIRTRVVHTGAALKALLKPLEPLNGKPSSIFIS